MELSDGTNPRKLYNEIEHVELAKKENSKIFFLEIL